MQIPFVGFQPVQSSEHMAAIGVFGLCQLYAFNQYLKSKLNKEDYDLLFRSLVLGIAFFGFLVGAVLTFLGSKFKLNLIFFYSKINFIHLFIIEISPWTGRFYSLLDPSYAKNNIPIIASVSEHQPTAWSSFYFDLQLLLFLFPVGLYHCFKHLTDINIFIVLYGLTSIYFAVSVMLFLIF